MAATENSPAPLPPSQPPPARFLKARWLLLTVVAVGAIVGWLILTRPNPPPTVNGENSAPAVPDPRLVYDGPFRNLQPDVKYVGDRACAECHAEISESYRRHPMGRSLVPIEQHAAQQRYDAKVNNPFLALGSRFLVERQGDRMQHRQTRLGPDGEAVYERTIEPHFVIGSGARGFSYVTNRDGYLFQTPVSWFSQQGMWDLSPGFKIMHVTSRAVHGTCLFCHANQAHFVEESANRYQVPIFSGHAIGCERCHGPGERHAATKNRWDIVNPRRLEPALREAVCQQCHLEGSAKVLPRGRSLYDFRPGLPLGSCWSIFVDAQELGANRKAVNHVEQMYLSRCFQGSAGKDQMGCISCHDPHVHVKPAERVGYYRTRCLNCHQERGCSAPLAERQTKSDSCIACHMPPYGSTDIAHTAATDHRILRRPDAKVADKAGTDKAGTDKVGTDKVGADPQGAAEMASFWTGLPIRPFHALHQAPPDADLQRDTGVALAVLMMQGKIDPVLHSTRAYQILQSAVTRDASDVEAWEAQAHVLLLENRRWQALTAFDKALARQPRREVSLAAAALLAQMLKEDDRAIRYWRRALEVNPYKPEYHAHSDHGAGGPRSLG